MVKHHQSTYKQKEIHMYNKLSTKDKLINWTLVVTFIGLLIVAGKVGM